MEAVDPGRGVVQGGEEFQVAPVGGLQDFPQSGQAVDTLLHGRPLGDGSPVALFYRAVVLEKGNVVHRGLDSQDQPEFVVHLERDGSHGVFDSGPFDANVEPVAHLPLVERTQLAAQEGGDVIGLHGVDGGAGQMPVERLQVLAAAEEQIGGELDLIQAPVVAHLELPDHRAIAPSPLVQLAMQLLHRPVVSDLLSALEVLDLHEGVVEPGVDDLFSLQAAGQPVMPVEINLQPEGTPSGDADIAQAQLFIDEVKVIMQALAVVGAQKGLARGLVVPGGDKWSTAPWPRKSTPSRDGRRGSSTLDESCPPCGSS